MKKSFMTLIGALSLGAALPALAGPDWQLLEHGRKAKAARMQAAAQPAQTSGSSTSSTSQPDDRSANKEQMMKECAEMMKKS